MKSRRTATSRPPTHTRPGPGPGLGLRRAAAILGSAVLLVVGACGSDTVDSATDAVPTTAPITTPGQSPPPTSDPAAPTVPAGPDPTPTTPTAPDDQEPTAVPPTTEPSQSPTAVPPSGVVPPDQLAEAETAVLTFVDSLGRGDLAAAAAAIGPVSEQHANDAGGLEPLLRASTEGHGAWVAATDRTVMSVGIEPGLAIVVLEGTLQIEGTAEHRVAAFPVRRAESGGVWFVEPWAFDIVADPPPLVVVDPPVDAEEHASINPAGPFQVVVEASEGGTIWASFDGVVTSTELPEAAEATFAPDDGPPTLVVLVHQSGPDLYATAFVTDL